ncbi:MAG: CPBP family intramembrane metalloprotease [Promethearchaeota archaeon]|nr:MAG: CPBP family intramembrane metalloprotease [Candidatus Lokiarchaeota archaeon]
MVIIKEKSGKFLHFFTASLVVGIGGLLLSFLSILISFIIILTNFSLPFDYVITNLLIAFLSQLIGAFVVYFVFIPLFKAKNSEFHHLTLFNSLKTIILICATFTFVASINFGLIYIFKIFSLNPQSGYTNILLNTGHLASPLNIIIYYLPLTIGAAVYEELLYRRLLIPLLEQRGMRPSPVIFFSSLLFALAHLPDDLISANPTETIMHISAVFFIGISLGLIYVITRNILYSMLIHGVLNFISFTRPLVILIANSALTLAFDIIYWTIFIVGIGVLIFGLWQFLRKQNAEWVILIREKQTNPILYGTFGFLIMGIIGIFIPFIIQNVVIGLEIAIYSVLLYFIVLIVCYGAFLVLFLWLGTRAMYVSKII